MNDCTLLPASRREVLLTVASALAAGRSWAESASLPLRLIVPAPPGSELDAVARGLAQPWAQAGGCPVVVDNIPGAGSSLGTARLVRAAKDGLTLGLVSASHTVNPWLYKSLPYDAVADITPIAMVGTVPALLVAARHVPADTPGDLVRHANASRRPLHEGVIAGSAYQMASEVFKDQAGIATTTVSYKGPAQLVADLLVGMLDIGIVPAPAAVPHVAAGKLKALAVTSAARTALVPLVPTLAEAGMRHNTVQVWLAVVGPAGLGAAVVAARRREIGLALADAGANQALQQQGVQPIAMAQGEMLPFFRRELERNRQIVQRVGITMD